MKLPSRVPAVLLAALLAAAFMPATSLAGPAAFAPAARSLRVPSAVRGAGPVRLPVSASGVGTRDIATATPLPASPFTGPSISDTEGFRDQTYTVHLDAGQTIHLSAMANAGTDLQFYLYAPDTGSFRDDTATALAMSERTSYPEEFTYTANEPGDYFVVAFAYDGTSPFTIEYKINRRIALLVGIADYSGTNHELSAPVDDVDDMYRMLVNVGGFDQGNIHTLLDGNATKASIQNGIQNVLGATNAADEVFFYYSGHGEQVADVAPLDESDGKDEAIVDFNLQPILDDDLATWFASVPATNVVMCFDSCFAGGMTKSVPAEGAKVRTLTTGAARTAGVTARDAGARGGMQDLMGTGRLVIAAADVTEQSLELSTLKNGIFTFFFTQAMNETAANTDKDLNVSVQEAFERAKPEVVSLNARWGNADTPQISDGIGSELEWFPHGPISRLAGGISDLSSNSRYGTAIEIGWHEYPATAPSIVLARGDKFPDALCAAPLAAAALGPILLVRPEGIDQELADEIARLNPAQIYIIGDDRSIPADTETQIRGIFDDAGLATPPTITRFAGNSRYDTSKRVALEVRDLTVGPGRPVPGVVLATGLKFPDALAAAPFAAAKGWPILLTEKDALPSYTAQARDALDASETLVVGDTRTISDAVKNQMPKPTRKGGSNRYETGALVITWALAHGLEFKTIGLATGESFADALSAGPMLGSCNGPIVLSGSVLSSYMAAVVTQHGGSVENLDILGGERSLPKAVVDDFFNAKDQAP
jgi:putative cell wall-binding protein